MPPCAPGLIYAFIHLISQPDGKHLPPLTLKDFEDYLVFEAHSAENLYVCAGHSSAVNIGIATFLTLHSTSPSYFICWLRDYTAAYNKYQDAQAKIPAEKREERSPELTISFARARSTFFDSSSHLELNLPSELLEPVVNPNANPTPSPADLADIQKHVEGMLRESLMKFVVGSCKNSGRRRGFFAIFVGMAAILVGLAPVLMSILRGESRYVRLAALLPFWFGAMTAIAGFHGVCIVIFLFGDARQLYPYELARPKLPCTIPVMEPLSLPMPVTTAGGGGGKPWDGSVSGSSYIDEKAMPMSPMSTAVAHTPELGGGETVRHSGSGSAETVPETAGFIPTYEPSISGQSHAASTSGGSSSMGSGSPYKFDFDALPGPSASFRKSKDWTLEDEKSSTFRERTVFASLTKVFSPIVSRAQWEIIVRSSLLGVLVALVLGGICFAVPFKDGQSW